MLYTAPYFEDFFQKPSNAPRPQDTPSCPSQQSHLHARDPDKDIYLSFGVIRLISCHSSTFWYSVSFLTKLPTGPAKITLSCPKKRIFPEFQLHPSTTLTHACALPCASSLNLLPTFFLATFPTVATSSAHAARPRSSPPSAQ